MEYTLVGDYDLPNLTLPEEHCPIGKWGRMHREYQTITDCLIFQNSLKLGARMLVEVLEE